MMNATEMTRTEVLAEIQRLAEIAVNMTPDEDPREEIKKIDKEIGEHKGPHLKSGEEWGECYEAESSCRISKETENFKNTLLNIMKSMGFKQTGSRVYSAKVGNFKNKIDFCMRIEFTTCSKPNAIVRDRKEGKYKYLECATLDEAANLFKLSKRRTRLRQKMLYGDCVVNRLNDCISAIQRDSE